MIVALLGGMLGTVAAQGTDGFTGLGGTDAYNLRKPMTMTVGAYDAGSEKNNERKPYLVAFMGTRPDSKRGVV